MQVEVKKAKMTKKVIKSIAEIDKEFYANFDYNDLSWYYERYSNKNEIFLLLVDNKIVGYFFFLEISQALFNDILKLKYDGDFYFPTADLNCKSGYFYLPSVAVKKEYRNFSQTLLKRLYLEVLDKKNLVAIVVSSEGQKLASKLLEFVGIANEEKGVKIYKKP